MKQASLWALLAKYESEIEASIYSYIPHERERTPGSQEMQTFLFCFLETTF